MPLYEYRCDKCQIRLTRFLPLARYKETQFCEGCANQLERVISAPAVHGDYQGYECPVTGKWIEGRRAHEENLKRTGCRVLEPGETEGVMRRQSTSSTALEDKIAESAAQAVAAMPQEKLNKLESELSAGADISFERKTVGE